MSRHGWVFTRPRGFLAGVAGLLMLQASAASAQTADCQRLQASLDAMGPSDGGGGETMYDRAAARQRAEIGRTRDYAASVGCGNPTASDFDDDQPHQCAGLAERIARMEGNLSQIEARGRQLGGDNGARAGLLAQVKAACATTLDAPPPAATSDPADLRTAPLDPDAISAVPPGADIGGGSEAPAPHGAQAICVRSCDGGFFPLGRAGGPEQLDHLEQLCRASCPNTEAHLYTRAEDATLDGATSVDGQPYTALPAAHAFETRFTPSCTCKPPGQSWLQALAEADKLIEAHEGDVTVTRQMSEDMAKPVAAPPPAAPAKGRRRAGAKPTALPRVAASPASQSPTVSADLLPPPPDVPPPALGPDAGVARRTGKAVRRGATAAVP